MDNIKTAQNDNMTKETQLEHRKRAKARKPKFIRQDAHKKSCLTPLWRKPKGLQSKMRKMLSGHRKMVKPGFGSPGLVKGFSRSGKKLIVVNNLSDIPNDNDSAIILGGTLGKRKKIEILKKIQGREIEIINLKDIGNFIKITEDLLKAKKEISSKSKKEKEVKQEKLKEAKKEEKELPKEEETEKTKEKKDLDRLLTKKQ